MSIFERKSRILDISDTKWGHPEATGSWQRGLEPNEPVALLMDPTISDEERRERYQKLDFSMYDVDQDTAGVEIKEYEVPGCPEEPDTPAKALVYTPADLKAEKAPTLFYLTGGRLMINRPKIFPIPSMCKKYNCVIVVPLFRTSIYAEYPAAINDCHAAYKWMVDNAKMLHVDTDCVVLSGTSSGGHLATCMPFRLMKNGYSPRGVVAIVPITDDRSMHASARTHNGRWDGGGLHDSYAYWMGDKFASAEVGPEAFANHATVEECVGYPPLFIHTGEWDPDRDNNKEFIGKVLEAHSFCEYHIWGGYQHGVPLNRAQAIIDNNIMDCFKYDLRRPWVYESNEEE